MARFALRRLLIAVPVVIIVTLITFVLLSRLPGNAAESRIGIERGIDTSAYKAMVEELHLNQPIAVRYVDWSISALRGNLGTSLRTNQSVTGMILQRFPVTLEVSILALILALIIGFTLGVISANKPESLFDNVATFFVFANISIPVFWLAILMIYFFSVDLRWLPPSGYVPLSAGLWPHLQRMIMPAIAVSLAPAALITRQVRGAVLGVLGSEYVTAARAKGLSRPTIFRQYVMRNAMIPVLTVIGLEVASLLAGSVLAEEVFGLPGIGQLLVESIFFRDFTMVQGIVVLIAVMLVILNLVTDIVYAWVDPRVRYE